VSDAEQATPGDARPNPYIGPRAFQRGETLYGRDREVRELLDLLIAERIVLLHSPSGAGKTSLILAALIPELEAEHFAVLPVLRLGLKPSSSGEPSEPPANRCFLNALLSLEDDLPPEAQIPLGELATWTLGDYLDRRAGKVAAAGGAAGRADGDLVPVFDQFEEILTADPTDVEAKAEFFAQMGTTLRDRWALFAMREEYLAALDPFLRPMPTRLNTTYRLDLLGRDMARQAIQEPTRHAGVQFTDPAATKLVDDLRRAQVQRADGQLVAALGEYVEPVLLDNRAIWLLVDAHPVRAEKQRGATWLELAHDRLIGPVQADNAAWRKRHLSPLQHQATLWESQGRPEGLLLRDEPLEDAERWLANHRSELMPAERDFVAACRAAAERHLLEAQARQAERLQVPPPGHWRGRLLWAGPGYSGVCGVRPDGKTPSSLPVVSFPDCGHRLRGVGHRRIRTAHDAAAGNGQRPAHSASRLVAES
jgi:hypothetical protein